MNLRLVLPALCMPLLLANPARSQEADFGFTPGTRAAAPATPRATRDRASELVLAALQFIDVPYRRGGTSDQGFDCSGFTRHIFDLAAGLVLPRRADEQARAAQLREVDRHELRPGDLVFFNTLQRTFSHVGIYVGDGRFIHAPRTGSAVRIDSMAAAYWARRYTGARRLAEDAAPRVYPAAAVSP